MCIALQNNLLVVVSNKLFYHNIISSRMSYVQIYYIRFECSFRYCYFLLSHVTRHYSTLHYTASHYTTLHHTTLRYTTHYTTLQCTTLLYITLHYTALHYTIFSLTEQKYNILFYCTKLSLFEILLY